MAKGEFLLWVGSLRSGGRFRHDAMIRRIAIAVVALAFLGLLGFSLSSWRAGIAPVEPPNPASFSAESVAKGEVLAAGGIACLATSGQADSHLPAATG